MAEKTGGKKFTGALISDVLRGKPGHRTRGETIAEYGFRDISTWGLMKEFSQSSLADMIDFLTAEKLLATDENFGTISFTDRSFPFLKNKTRLMMRRHKEQIVVKKTKMKTKAGVNLPGNEELFEELRKLRREIADFEKVPSFVVFSDKTLHAMCETSPSNEDEFLSVSGVGKNKLEKYGARFLEVIRSWKKKGE
jgi:ATP-dependent DNA helicase RecQ